MEVMGDYATVFSQERGFDNESCSGSGGGSDSNGSSSSSSVYDGGTKSLHYRVKSSRPEVYNIVTDVLNNDLTGWNELPSGLGLGMSWNLLWTWSKPRVNLNHLLIWQKGIKPQVYLHEKQEIRQRV